MTKHNDYGVCSLELSKLLSKLKIKKDSNFYWVNGFESEDVGWLNYGTFTKPVYDRFELHSGNPLECDRYGKPDKNIKWYPAYTVAELGEMLPFNCYSRRAPNNVTSNKWACIETIEHYFGSDSGESVEIINHIEFAPNEADARALMVIYLHKNKRSGKHA